MHYSKRYNMIPMPLFEYINHFCNHSTVIFVIISKKIAIVFGVFESNLRSARTDHVCHVILVVIIYTYSTKSHLHVVPLHVFHVFYLNAINYVSTQAQRGIPIYSALLDAIVLFRFISWKIFEAIQPHKGSTPAHSSPDARHPHPQP